MRLTRGEIATHGMRPERIARRIERGVVRRASAVSATVSHSVGSSFKVISARLETVSDHGKPKTPRTDGMRVFT